MHNTKVCKDRIYHQLDEDQVRNKILNGQLERQDCNDKAVYKLLKLLEQPEHLKNTTQ